MATTSLAADLADETTRRYIAGDSALDAALAAKQHLGLQQYIPDRPVQWTLLEQLQRDPSRIGVQFGGVAYRSASTRLLQADDGTLLLPLETVEPALRRKHDTPMEGEYSITLQGQDQPWSVSGEYNLGEPLQALAPQGLTNRGAGECFALTLPITGLVGEQEVAQHQLPASWLEVGARVAKNKQQTIRGETYALVLRVDPRPDAAAVLPARMQFAPSSKQFWYTMPAYSTQYEPPAPRDISNDELEQAGRELIAAAGAETGDGFSLYVFRDGKQLLGLESAGNAAASREYDIGELTQLLTVPALINYALSTASNRSMAETILHNTEWLGAALREHNAAELAAALEALYRRNNSPMPTLAQMLSHTSGLPCHPTPGMHDLQWMLTDTEEMSPTGDLQRDLAQMIQNKTQLLDKPGAFYHPSALAFAILAFTLPGDSAAPVLETVRTLSGGAGSFARRQSDSNYQGAYFLYSGLRIDAASLARALARNAFFEYSARREPLADAPHMNWLWKLARPRTPLRRGQLAAGYGAWMSSVINAPDTGRQIPAAYAVGRADRTMCAVVQLPVTGAMALLCIEKQRERIPCALETLHRMAKMLDSLHGQQPQSGTGPQYRMPDESREMMQSRRRAERILQTMGAASDRNESMQPLLGRWYSLADRDTIVDLEIRPTPPERVPRYLLTVRRAGMEAQYIVVYDAERAADAESPAQMPGGLRVIDPVTHQLSAPLDAVMLRSQKHTSRTETILLFDGMFLVREQMFKDVAVRYDPMNTDARRRAMAMAAQKESRRRRKSERKRAQLLAVRAALRDDDLSSDDDEEEQLGREMDADDDDDEEDDNEREYASEQLDIFSALNEPIDGDRTAHGRWHKYMGTERISKKAVWLAYPVGERLYVLAEYINVHTMPYY